MKLSNEFGPIREWARDKGIYEKGDLKTQTIKFYEEAGELAKAVLNEDTEEIIDAIGDSIVVLTSVAYFAGVNVEECINEAYRITAKRKGKMQNGTFIKD